ncbi:sortase [Candidatus Woesebacteria bacterium]|nr:sortase [Candidatus Woesebacteria bacterium]
MSKTILRLVAIITFLAGIGIILVIFFPIISYNYFSTGLNLLNPIVGENNDIPKGDLTKASNWFVGGASGKDFNSNKVFSYTISIPKLKIQDATVIIGSEDLSKSLVQYPTAVSPGRVGNTVVFGHSALPLFFDPKRYTTIFSTLPTLKKGDQIEVRYDGVTYLYRVENMFEVLPTDLSVLSQNMDDSYLTLITCTPPGDPRNPKRLIVRSKIVSPEEKTYNSYQRTGI